MDFTGKTAVVTGAASGIGAEVVRLFLESGANVVGVDVQEPPVPAALRERFAGRLVSVRGDVSQEATAVEYARQAVAAFGRIDLLVNNAGIACIKPLHEHTEAEWDRVMDVNVKSLFWSARQVIPLMKQQKSGVVVNIGSISSVCGMMGQGAYGPSKGAVIQLTRQMAIEYAADGIRVNAVCPGTVDTPLLQSAAVQSGDPAGFLKRLADGHPIGRIAAAEEIAQFVRFVCSDHARFMTGAVLMLDGGYSAQ
ncbi:MAG: SDR family oxidoreductase [Planctomycetaceae bacterium]|nr:SDR family oxidoreductase [Planctomycetaceae bacterium]